MPPLLRYSLHGLVFWLVVVLVFIACVACVKDETVACSVPDGRVLATSTNDRARRARYSDLTDAQYDSVAKASCWTTVR